jgi:hypothetical protein
MTKNNKYEPGDWYKVYPIIALLTIWKWYDNITRKLKQILKELNGN